MTIGDDALARALVRLVGNQAANSMLVRNFTRVGVVGIFRSLTGMLSFCTFTLLLFGQSGAQENLFDKAAFHRAADYCRSVVERPIALSDDQAILCLDGRIEKDADVSPAKKLKEGGRFVVRSAGGASRPRLLLPRYCVNDARWSSCTTSACRVAPTIF
ncbi:hypothetical protein [Bradyrhizobium sp. I71]|uniref:hypothetical protein n=1 Tax=Bradyrhizobium sp. I71 TaxID=2590772 RepID=UPI001EF91F9F|nr:hypothetical protein [Bradyrhizobium sp. I71]ULK99356.1 hypothetical protein FJV43_06320 [Bradyrhizobium sp. I71]